MKPSDAPTATAQGKIAPMIAPSVQDWVTTRWEDAPPTKRRSTSRNQERRPNLVASVLETAESSLRLALSARDLEG